MHRCGGGNGKGKPSENLCPLKALPLHICEIPKIYRLLDRTVEDICNAYSLPE